MGVVEELPTAVRPLHLDGNTHLKEPAEEALAPDLHRMLQLLGGQVAGHNQRQPLAVSGVNDGEHHLSHVLGIPLCGQVVNDQKLELSQVVYEGLPAFIETGNRIGQPCEICVQTGNALINQRVGDAGRQEGLSGSGRAIEQQTLTTLQEGLEPFHIVPAGGGQLRVQTVIPVEGVPCQLRVRESGLPQPGHPLQLFSFLFFLPLPAVLLPGTPAHTCHGDAGDLEKHKVRIDTTLIYTPARGIYENPTKTGDVRQIALPAETVALLREYRRSYLELKLANGDRWQETGYVFVRDDGRPMSPDSIGQWLARFSKRHGLPHINPHAFRHTVATVLINSGTDIVSVSKRLGHARTSTTTDIYAHVIEQADEKATETLANAILRKHA